jgi:hypothetical protein
MDSDNFADKDYFDALLFFTKGNLSKDTVYCPSFAMTNFDFREVQGKSISESNIQQFISERKTLMHLLFNTGNYCLSKHSVNIITNLLSNNDEVQEMSKGIYPCMVTYMNYWLLVHGCSFSIVPKMYYQHVIHSKSFYLETHEKYPELIKIINDKFFSIGK